MLNLHENQRNISRSNNGIWLAVYQICLKLAFYWSILKIQKIKYQKHIASWIFKNWTYSYNQYPDQETEHYLHPRSTLILPATTSHSHPRVTTTTPSISMFLPIFVFHINGIIHYILLCLASFAQIIFVRLIYIRVCSHRSFILTAELGNSL